MKKLSMDDPYLTVDQVAGIFSVRAATVREWLRVGKIDGVKLGNSQWRIQHSEMERYANKKYGESA